SNKASKTDVLKQMAAALNAKADLDTEAWTVVADTLARRRDELNEYVEALHRRRPAGLRLWDGLNRLIELADAPEIPGPTDAPRQVEEGQIDRWRKLLADMASAWRLVDDPSSHPFADCRFDTATRVREREADEALGKLVKALSKWTATLEQASSDFHLDI